jgi:hypothetical protein
MDYLFLNFLCIFVRIKKQEEDFSVHLTFRKLIEYI